jgi:hypothetical protein
MATRRKPEEMSRPRRPPATTPEGREKQLIDLAMDLTERQLVEGTVSSQNLNHFLKAGSMREQLEQQRIRHENELLQVKKEQIEGMAKMDELVAAALYAMKGYQGRADEDEDVHGVDEPF